VIAAVLLAAGQSKRMGAANKLLLPVAGGVMIERALALLAQCPLSQTVVVTGFEPHALRPYLTSKQQALSCVHNPDYGQGLASSLARGINGLTDDCDGVMVMLADMPLLSAGTLNQLIEAFYHHGGDRVVMPQYQGQRGNPLIWPRAYFPQLVALQGDSGGRQLLAQCSPPPLAVTVAERAVLFDVDTPADYQALQQLPKSSTKASYE
jgi:molybdenum cofactor cytidylyltransferase